MQRWPLCRASCPRLRRCHLPRVAVRRAKLTKVRCSAAEVTHSASLTRLCSLKLELLLHLASGFEMVTRGAGGWGYSELLSYSCNLARMAWHAPGMHGLACTWHAWAHATRTSSVNGAACASFQALWSRRRFDADMSKELYHCCMREPADVSLNGMSRH